MQPISKYFLSILVLLSGHILLFGHSCLEQCSSSKENLSKAEPQCVVALGDMKLSVAHPVTLYREGAPRHEVIEIEENELERTSSRKYLGDSRLPLLCTYNHKPLAMMDFMSRLSYLEYLSGISCGSPLHIMLSVIRS
ncbi:MAG: hypothetical protein JST14_06370 [Bacteroidetes bacterium]|nr:hypothetical protein [Bacteroidota bacterium]